MTRRSIWIGLHTSLWLIPLLSLLFGGACALVLVQFDLNFHAKIEKMWPNF